MSFFTISSTIQSDNELRDIAWEYHNQLTAPSSQSCHQIVIACSLAPWLEKAMAPQSSTLVWKIPWMEEPGRLQSMRSRRVGHDWATSLSLSCIGEGNGNPLPCSCLENPRDGGAWWAASMGSHRVGHDWSDLAAAAASTMVGYSKLNTLSLSIQKFKPWLFGDTYSCKERCIKGRILLAPAPANVWRNR